jgi:hypothetical protein
VIVADASAIAELLLARSQAPAVRAALAPHPELDLRANYPVIEMADAVWELRSALTACDAGHAVLTVRQPPARISSRKPLRNCWSSTSASISHSRRITSPL